MNTFMILKLHGGGAVREKMLKASIEGGLK
jgi:hypothetical protein